jgi:RHS repeat-associated protein
VRNGTPRKYYYAGNVRVAMREGDILYWLLTDHLGSTAITLDASGNRVTELRYYPYGNTRYNPGGQKTNYRFTGQRWDQGHGLYWYNSRWYDPLIGRFLSPDPLVPEPGNPSHGDSLRSQGLNRYAYVNNNPLKYTDPTGHYISLEDDFGVRVTRTGVIQVVRGGSHFANPVEVALANAILSGEPRHLETIPADVPGWALQHSLDHVASELGYGGSAGAAGDLLLDPMVAFGLAFGMVKAAERGEILPAEGIPAGERLGYTETPWDATARNPNAIGRWGEQLVGQRLPEVAIGRWRIPGGGRVYDGRLLSTGQYVEVKTTTRGIVYLNAHIRRQIAFDAAQGTKPLWIFVGGSPSRGLQVELNKAGIPWQILEP